MLKTECPGCKNWVHSPLLAEMEETKCPTCGEIIKVKDIFISAGPFSIYRDALQKHLFKYTRLLKEAEKELEDLLKEGKDLKAYDISADTVKLFIAHLQELLAGCRSGFRLSVGGKAVNVNLKGSRLEGNLVNISITGVCVNVGRASAGAVKGDAVVVEFTDDSKRFSIAGEVVWASGGGELGVRFGKLDPSTRVSLLDYIKKGEESRAKG